MPRVCPASRPMSYGFLLLIHYKCHCCVPLKANICQRQMVVALDELQSVSFSFQMSADAPEPGTDHRPAHPLPQKQEESPHRVK